MTRLATFTLQDGRRIAQVVRQVERRQPRRGGQMRARNRGVGGSRRSVVGVIVASAELIPGRRWRYTVDEAGIDPATQRRISLPDGRTFEAYNDNEDTNFAGLDVVGVGDVVGEDGYSIASIGPVQATYPVRLYEERDTDNGISWRFHAANPWSIVCINDPSPLRPAVPPTDPRILAQTAEQAFGCGTCGGGA